MPIDPELTKAAELLKAGNQNEAGVILYQYLLAHPEDPVAWYGYSKCFTNVETQKHCLERTLELNPAFSKAKTELEEINARSNSANLITQSTSTYSVNYYPAEKIESQEKTIFPTHPMLTTRKVANELSEKNQKMKNRFGVLWVLLIGMGILVLVNPKNTKLLLWITAIALGLRLILPAFFDQYAKTRKKYRAYEKGAKGEETIVELLSTLGPDFAVWHDVMTRYGNIDHIVLCKNGSLFMIETKANSGTVDASAGSLLLNGHAPPKDMIAQCLRNIYSLKELLENKFGQTLWVQPILVFTNAFVHSGRPIKGIRVINKKYLLSDIHAEAGKITRNAWLWEKRGELDSILFHG